MAAGTFSFLFTDIEGSTALWDAFPEAMAGALEQHDRILGAAIENNGGSVFKTVGDAFCAVFPDAGAAVDAAIEAQYALAEAEWHADTGPLRVRMGIHSGPAQERDNDYFGPTLNVAARVQSVAYGEQLLISDAARAELASDAWPLVDLGVHRLKGVSRPVNVYQVSAAGLRSEFPPLHTLDLVRSNLPTPASKIVGREAELESARALLAESPILSLVGPGGMGKTRFSIELASKEMSAFPDGAWFVDLSGVAEGERVASTVAGVLGIRERADVPIVETIADWLADKKTIVVVDNCEQVVTAVADALGVWSGRAPRVRFIATTREQLDVPGERVLRLAPLGLADPHASREKQLAAASVRLFIERAKTASATFSADGPRLAPVVEICRSLDGIPLAIELAAARAGLFEVDALLERMNDMRRILTQRMREGTARQQTLEALVDWSYRLLDERDRTVLDRLSTFVGTYDVEAACRVCSTRDIDPLDVEDAVESLVKKSFVVLDASGERRRIRLFETIRQFAEHRLGAEPEEAEALVGRHASHYADVATRSTDEADEHLAAFAVDVANIRLAFRRTTSRTLLHRVATEIAVAIARYTLESGDVREGIDTIVAAYPIAAADAPATGLLQFIHAQLLMLQGRTEESAELFRRAAASDGQLRPRAEWGLARLALTSGRLVEARALIESSIGALETSGVRFALFQSYTTRISIDLALGDRAAARDAAEAALEVARANGHDRAIGIASGNLATLALSNGELDVAGEQVDVAIEITERSGAPLSAAYFLCVRDEVRLFCNDARAGADSRRALRLALDADWLELAARAAQTLAACESRAGNVARARAFFEWSLEHQRPHQDDDDRALSSRKRAIVESCAIALAEAGHSDASSKISAPTQVDFAGYLAEHAS